MISDRSEKKKNENKKFAFYGTWLLQILILAGIGVSIWAISNHGRVGAFTTQASITATLALYIMFYCFAIRNSTVYTYLNNFHKDESINDLLKNYFYSSPEIKLTCTCYHMVRTSKARRREVTHKDEQYFRFSSWQDTSGMFLINNGEISNKNYLKLRLDIDVEFADDMTKYDFNTFKENMIAVNKPKDVYMDYDETITFNNGEFRKYNLVSLGGNECLISKEFFIFFCIIPLVQFYKCFFNSRCHDQVFTLKKRVSTRYNLHDLEKANSNHIKRPSIKFNEKEFKFDDAPKDFNQCYDVPSEDQIMKAQTFVKDNKDGGVSELNRLNSNNLGKTYRKEGE